MNFLYNILNLFHVIRQFYIFCITFLLLNIFTKFKFKYFICYVNIVVYLIAEVPLVVSAASYIFKSRSYARLYSTWEECMIFPFISLQSFCKAHKPRHVHVLLGGPLQRLPSGFQSVSVQRFTSIYCATFRT